MSGAFSRLLLALFTVSACSSSERGVDTLHTTTLPAGVVARVGDVDIAASTALRIAAAQGVSARTAADRAISDALLAAAVSSELGAATRLRWRRARPMPGRW